MVMAPADDLEAAKDKTYVGFTNLLKWAIPVIAIIVLFVIYLIS